MHDFWPLPILLTVDGGGFCGGGGGFCGGGGGGGGTVKICIQVDLPFGMDT